MRGLNIRVSKAKSPRVSKGRNKGNVAKTNSMNMKRLRKHLFRAPK